MALTACRGLATRAMVVSHQTNQHIDHHRPSTSVGHYQVSKSAVRSKAGGNAAGGEDGDAWKPALEKERKRSKEHLDSTKQALVKQIRRVERLKSNMLGRELESEILESHNIIFADKLGRHAKVMDAKELFTIADTAMYLNVVSKEEKIAAISVDFVIMAGVFDDGRGQEYLVGEVSQKIELNDVERAGRRAAIWAKILGVSVSQCLPFVVGKRSSKKVDDQAQESGVSVVKIEDKMMLEDDS